MSEGSDTTRESASMSQGEGREALRGTRSSRGELLLVPKVYAAGRPEIGAEGSHILSHGAVNLGRTQIKFRARDEPPARKEWCVISLRLYERRRDQRSGNPESPIRLIERQDRNVYLFKLLARWKQMYKSKFWKQQTVQKRRVFAFMRNIQT